MILAITFGFELKHYGTWFALYSTGAPVIKESIINGKVRAVIVSFDEIPEGFNSLKLDEGEAFALTRKSSKSHSLPSA